MSVTSAIEGGIEIVKPMKSQSRGIVLEPGLEDYEQEFGSEGDDGALDI